MEKHARSLLQMMIGSSLLGVVFTIAGLWISYAFDLTSGASIIMVAGLFFFISLVIERVIPDRRLAMTPAESKAAAEPQRS